MKKTLILSALSVALTALAVPPPKLHGWNTWQRPEDGGKFERIKPSADQPQGAMKFLPDPEKKRYRIQWYRAIPASPTDHLRFIFTFRSASDTNPGVAVAFSMKGKESSGAWCKKSFDERQTVTVEPGQTQTVELEIDLRKHQIPELGFICPTVTLSGLAAGDVTFTALKIETVKDAPVEK